MEGEGEADRKEESAEPRGGGRNQSSRWRSGNKSRSEVRSRSRMEVQGSRRDGRAGSQFSAWERDHPEANREGFMAVIARRTRL